MALRCELLLLAAFTLRSLRRSPPSSALGSAPLCDNDSNNNNNNNINNNKRAASEKAKARGGAASLARSSLSLSLPAN